MAMRNSSVLGPDGQPLKVSNLSADLLSTVSTGIRQTWSNEIVTGLTPPKLASILRAANEGDNRDLLTLAEEMEERDTHFASVLGQRKRAVSGIDPVVTSKGTDKRAQEAKDAVEALVTAPIFDDMIDNLLDAISKGYSVIQPIWKFGEVWAPSKYKFEDQRKFRFDKESGEMRSVMRTFRKAGRSRPGR